jgi:GNAT superfamily N-acetyltransferase
MGKESSVADFPTTFLDRAEDFPPQMRRFSISQTNRQTVSLVRQLVVPTTVRHTFPTTRRQSQLVALFDLLHPSGTATSRTKTLETPAGQLFLRDFCPPSLVERLKADSGLHAFARLPEREHQLLLSIAKSPDCELALAHTPSGEIVGQVTLAPGDDWWEGFENVYEVTIEVSSDWRGSGLGRHLLAFALELDALEEMILFAMGLSWHWDTEGLGISIGRYRKLIARLFESQGFVEHETTEPNISMEPGNILLVRVGKNVDEYTVRRFFTRLQSSPTLSVW